jgi:hypothetical protein
MADFTHENLSGARFEDVYLTGADFHNVDLTGARFRLVDLTGVTIRGADLIDMDISGQIKNLTINGVDVAPLVEAELDRRYPGHAKMRPSDAAGYRQAWDVLEDLWPQTVARARRLDPELLHERVNGEWSFIETLRHLVFATDAWVNRAILGQPSPWDPLDLPHDEMPDDPSVPRDRDARPSLEEVLALRADRMATVRSLLAGLNDEQLAGVTRPVTEEWQHRLYAERDLDALERQSTAAGLSRQAGRRAHRRCPARRVRLSARRRGGTRGCTCSARRRSARLPVPLRPVPPWRYSRRGAGSGPAAGVRRASRTARRGSLARVPGR